MIAKNLRAAATAFVLGTAALVAMSMPADAAMRSSVGKPLQEAVSLAKSGNYTGAMAKVKQAEAVGGLSAEEAKGVNQMKEYLAAASNGSVGTDTRTGAEAKFAADNRAGRYREVIADEDLLRRNGALTATNQVVIAQAYYQIGDYKGCVRYASSHSGAGADMIKRGMLCAFKAGDDAMSRDMAFKLVTAAPTPDNWGQLLGLADRSKQLSDPQKLDIYRLKFLTGSIKGADDYFTLSQLLLAARFPSEADLVVQKGVAAKLMVDQRAQRLTGMVQKQKAADAGNIGKELAAANKSPKGDDLVRVGENLTGMGRYADAVNAIQAGIAKGVADADDAQVRLAVALYMNKQKAPALAALSKAGKSPNGKMIADLWKLYMR